MGRDTDHLRMQSVHQKGVTNMAPAAPDLHSSRPLLQSPAPRNKAGGEAFRSPTPGKTAEQPAPTRSRGSAQVAVAAANTVAAVANGHTVPDAAPLDTSLLSAKQRSTRASPAQAMAQRRAPTPSPRPQHAPRHSPSKRDRIADKRSANAHHHQLIQRAVTLASARSGAPAPAVRPASASTPANARSASVSPGAAHGSAAKVSKLPQSSPGVRAKTPPRSPVPAATSKQVKFADQPAPRARTPSHSHAALKAAGAAAKTPPRPTNAAQTLQLPGQAGHVRMRSPAHARLHCSPHQLVMHAPGSAPCAQKATKSSPARAGDAPASAGNTAYRGQAAATAAPPSARSPRQAGTLDLQPARMAGKPAPGTQSQGDAAVGSQVSLQVRSPPALGRLAHICRRNRNTAKCSTVGHFHMPYIDQALHVPRRGHLGACHTGLANVLCLHTCNSHI